MYDKEGLVPAGRTLVTMLDLLIEDLSHVSTEDFSAIENTKHMDVKTGRWRDVQNWLTEPTHYDTLNWELSKKEVPRVVSESCVCVYVVCVGVGVCGVGVGGWGWVRVCGTLQREVSTSSTWDGGSVRRSEPLVHSQHGAIVKMLETLIKSHVFFTRTWVVSLPYE